MRCARLVTPAVVVALLLPGCSTSCDREPRPRPATTAAAKAPVPVPEGHLGDVVIARPGRLLGELRAAFGAAALVVPRTLGGSVAQLLGLPIQVVEVVDEGGPLLAAAALVDGAVKGAVAVRVTDGPRLLTFVTHGRDATFSSEVEGAITWIHPKRPNREPQVRATLALIERHLVAGSDEAAVRALGLHLTRNLAAQPAPEADAHVSITGAASEPLRRALEPLKSEAWPLPREISTLLSPRDMVDAAQELLTGIGDGRVEVRLDATRLEIEGLVTRPGEARPTLSPTGPLDLPEDVVAAISWAEAATAREKQVPGRAARLRAALGPSASDEDEEVIRQALAAVARGMGERVTLGVRCTGVGLTGLARGEVSDAKSLLGGLDDLVSLRTHPAVVSHLDQAALSLSFDKRRLERVPFDLFRLRLVPSHGDAPRSEIDLLYGVDPSGFVAAAGMETVESAQRLVRPDPQRLLGKREALAQALARLPDPAFLTAVVDAQGLHACTLGKPGGDHVTPVVLGIGPTADGLRVRFEMPRLLLRAVGNAL